MHIRSTIAPEQNPQQRRDAVGLNLHDWLMDLDNGQGDLLQYLGARNTEFDGDFAQISAVKLCDPVEGVNVVDSINPCRDPG